MDLSILIYILLIIAFAKAIGEVFSRLNQPSVVGELLAGILLGPFILGKLFPTELGPMYDPDHMVNEFLSNLADLGVLFLMLYIGLEFSISRLVSSSWIGGLIAAAGMALPLAVGLYAGVLLGLDSSALAFFGVAVSVTALPVTIRILKDMDVLGVRTSEIIISSALITDLALLTIMSVILGGSDGASIEVVYLGAGFLLFFFVAYLIGRYVIPRIYIVMKAMRTGEAAFAVAIGIAIAFAVLAEQMGLPAFIGAFIAGLLLRETGTGLKVWTRVEDILSGITIGFLAPVFFVMIGFSVDFVAVETHLTLFIAAVSTAVICKIAGSYAAARLAGLKDNESLAIGSMMMGKGAMELVFATIALEQGIIGNEVFSALVLMAFVATFLAPMMFRYFFNRAVCAREIPAGSDRGCESAKG